jgi:benzoyl-CoA reductase/2-hydroxyglutaryl-CoA dehydratase subunit BcrC/BadD/HgdB
MMLKLMEQQTAATLRQKRSARALWYNEWAKLYLRAFEPDKKIVYASAYAFPLEILSAFDIVSFDFELSSGIIGTTEMGVPTMAGAENQGCSSDICSFHRIALGAFYKDYFPRPDLLITTSYYCDGKAKTNEILSILNKKESLLLYVPWEINKDSIRYVEKQLRQIALTVSQVAGQKLDEDRLKEAVRNSNRARESHLKLMDLLKHRPAPWGGRELVSYSINGLVFTGSEVQERLNKAFIEEMEQRIETGGLRPERHRIFWFAWIPTYQCNLFDVLKEHQVSVAMCETLRIYWDEIDEDNPFEGLALKCLKNPFVGPLTRRTERLETIRDEYTIDGTILFATPACRHSKSTFRLLKDSAANLGIPFLMLDIDISDPRGYSPEQTRTRLESFVELLDQNTRYVTSQPEKKIPSNSLISN